MKTKHYRGPRAFTLIEVLITILIVATLAALIFPALASSIRATKRAVVQAEFSQLSQGIAVFATKYGSHPPSRLVCSETGDYSAAFFNAQWAARTDRHVLRLRSANDIRRLWPRVKLSDVLLSARDPADVYASNPIGIPGCTYYDFNGNGKIDIAPYELTGDECLPFFLGGVPRPIPGTSASSPTSFGLIGFATDPRNPFQPETYIGPNDLPVTPARTASTEFKVDRLFDQDNDGVPAYADGYHGSSALTPYVYFASTGAGQYDPSDCDFTAEPSGDPMPVAGFRLPGGDVASPGPNPYAASAVLPTGPPGYATGPLIDRPGFSVSWINPNGYQILAAGTDRRVGVGGWFDQRSTTGKLPWPGVASAKVTGATYTENPRDGERDNLTNFSAGPLD